MPGMPEATKARYCAARGAAVHAANPNPNTNTNPNPNSTPNPDPNPTPNQVHAEAHDLLDDLFPLSDCPWAEVTPHPDPPSH